jgi:hypothetical protein
MKSSPTSESIKKSCRFNGIGFGINVFLCCHMDLDFTLSSVQVNIDNTDYCMDDKIVCYFCFPRIGMAVVLRPGDYLLFNAREPHCLSSRCHEDDQLYSISCYLKTSVVGLNGNSIPCIENA